MTVGRRELNVAVGVTWWTAKDEEKEAEICFALIQAKR